MKAFPLNFMVGSGFLLTSSFHKFSGEKPGGVTNFWFAEDLRTVKLGGEACVLRCVYLSIGLLFVYLLLACMFAF